MQPGHCANHGDRLIATTIVIFAFLLLAYCITAAGTARFALAMGYGEAFGYAVGLVLELGKSVLPILVMSLWHARVRVLACRVLACLIGVALLGLVTYSALATHGTVNSAIASVARIGTQHMQTRSGVESDLARVEMQLDALSVPQPPRPVPTVRHALDAEKVPPGIWRDSRECRSIRDSTHFQKACNKVVQLRGELAAGQDYENLSRDARALREKRDAVPIRATSDPLSEAFEATLGRWLPIEGRAGVAVLVTIVLEIMSSCGLAALRALKNASSPEEDAVKPRAMPASEVSPVPTKVPPTERGAAIASKLPARPRKSRSSTRAQIWTGSRDAVCPFTEAGNGGETFTPTHDGLPGRKEAGAPSSCGGMRSSPMPPTESFGVHSPTLGSGSGGHVSPVVLGSAAFASEIAAETPRTHTRRPPMKSHAATATRAPAASSRTRPGNIPGARTRAYATSLFKGGRGEDGASHPQCPLPVLPASCVCVSHIAGFVRECLEISEGASISFATLRSTYHRWCAATGRDPVSDTASELHCGILAAPNGNPMVASSTGTFGCALELSSGDAKPARTGSSPAELSKSRASFGPP